MCPKTLRFALLVVFCLAALLSYRCTWSACGNTFCGSTCCNRGTQISPMPPKHTPALPQSHAHYCPTCLCEFHRGTTKNPKRRSRRTDGLCVLHATSEKQRDVRPRMRVKQKEPPKKLAKLPRPPADYLLFDMSGRISGGHEQRSQTSKPCWNSSGSTQNTQWLRKNSGSKNNYLGIPMVQKTFLGIPVVQRTVVQDPTGSKQKNSGSNTPFENSSDSTKTIGECQWFKKNRSTKSRGRLVLVHYVMRTTVFGPRRHEKGRFGSTMLWGRPFAVHYAMQIIVFGLLCDEEWLLDSTRVYTSGPYQQSGSKTLSTLGPLLWYYLNCCICRTLSLLKEYCWAKWIAYLLLV